MSSKEISTGSEAIDLQFYGTIPFLAINGPEAVETVSVAAEWAKRFDLPEYVGRDALKRIVDLRHLRLAGSRTTYGLTDRGIVNRLERAFTKRGKRQAAIGRLANVAYHEGYNHKGEDGQRIRLIEDDAELAVELLRTLSSADPEAVNRMWSSDNDVNAVETAQLLVQAVDIAYENPKQLSE